MDDNAVSLYRATRQKLLITKLLRVYIRNSEYLKSAGLTQKNKSISTWKDVYDQPNFKTAIPMVLSKFMTIFSDAFSRAVKPLKEAPEHQALRCDVVVVPKSGVVNVSWRVTDPVLALWDPMLSEISTQFTRFNYRFDRYRNSYNLDFSINLGIRSILNGFFHSASGGLPSDTELEELLVQPYVEQLTRVFNLVGQLPARAAAAVAAEQERVRLLEEAKRIERENFYKASDFIPDRHSPSHIPLINIVPGPDNMVYHFHPVVT